MFLVDGVHIVCSVSEGELNYMVYRSISLTDYVPPSTYQLDYESEPCVHCNAFLSKSHFIIILLSFPSYPKIKATCTASKG